MDGSVGGGIQATTAPSYRRYLGNEEPRIEELLNDPIAALLRRSDRLSLEDVCRCVADAMARRRYRAGGGSLGRV